MDLEETRTGDANEDFEMMTAGEWLSREDVSPANMLFGEFWHEGELAVVFGDTSSGKSLLAVQIAESIARGKAVKPLEMTGGEQKVLLLDLARSREQFARTYSAEADADEGKHTARAYEFSPNLIRLSLRDAVHLAPAKLGPLIEKTGAKVLIIDSLAYLQRNTLPRETLAVMRELRRLRNRFGLSILVVMNTSRIINRRGIELADIPCASIVATFADSIYAMGRSGSRTTVRYLKQIKHSFGDGPYRSAHLPYFAIVRRGGNFPELSHVGHASEATLREQDNDHWEWDRIRKIKRLADQKKTVREIANALEMSRSTVHRLLTMAGDAPPLPSASAFVEERVRQFYGREKCIVEECIGCGTCNGRAARDYTDVPGTIIKGHDGNRCPDDCDMCGPKKYADDDKTVDPVLKRQSANHYRALRQWLLAGKPPPKPVYPGAKRYGVEKANWKPGSENWTEEQVAIYDKWIRTSWRTHEREPDFNGTTGTGP